MKSEFLDVQYFKILPHGSFAPTSSRAEIITAAESHPEFPHIIGTPKFVTEEKINSSGRYFIHQFGFSVPSYTTDADLAIIRNAAAVVIYTDTRTLVLYANDVFSNTPIQFNIKSNADVTDVSLTRQSINIL